MNVCAHNKGCEGIRQTPKIRSLLTGYQYIHFLDGVLKKAILLMHVPLLFANDNNESPDVLVQVILDWVGRL